MLIPADPVHAFVDYPGVPVAHAATGPLAGLTFAVKDIFDVAGYPTGLGNPTVRAEATPATVHARSVALLLEAGARFVGKTHTVEFAFGMDGRNPHYGTPTNPAAPNRVPGGSSSGSAAAVAAGLVDFALGSDTGGSVRGPASFCGLIGLRTSHGRIDSGGVMRLSESLDTVGWFARTAEIYERVGAVLLGDDEPAPPLSRLIVAEDAMSCLKGQQELAALTTALAAAGTHFSARETTVLAPKGLSAWRATYRAIQGFESWRNHAAWIAAHPGALSASVHERFEGARAVSPARFARAEAPRREVRRRLEALLGDDAVIALPTMPSVAPLLTQSEAALESYRINALSLTCAASLSGVPQISLPLAMHAGAPLGLSLMAPTGRDRALIALGRRILAA